MRRLGLVAFGAVIAGVLLVANGRASLHHPDEPMALEVNAKGEPQALRFEEFSRRRLVLVNMQDANRPFVDPESKNKEKTERGKVADRIAAAQKKPARTPEQSAALAVDLLRFGRAAEAPDALRGQRRGFLPNITLAHVAAAQGEWGQAYQYLDIANEERPPAAVPGLTAAQLAWQLKLNRGPLLKLVQSRWKEVREKEARRKEGKPAELPPDDELPDPIFPVNFANVTGPALAPAERDKLPPDALATVQQLLLWFPTDPRLYWLLAELYAVKGDFADAQKIMNSCVESLKYSNRKVLMQHREAVAKAAAQLAPPPDDPLLGTDKPAETTDPPAPPLTLSTVWWYFGVVGLIALFAGARAVLKWKKGPAR